MICDRIFYHIKAVFVFVKWHHMIRNLIRFGVDVVFVSEIELPTLVWFSIFSSLKDVVVYCRIVKITISSRRWVVLLMSAFVIPKT